MVFAKFIVVTLFLVACQTLMARAAEKEVAVDLSNDDAKSLFEELRRVTRVSSSPETGVRYLKEFITPDFEIRCVYNEKEDSYHCAARILTNSYTVVGRNRNGVYIVQTTLNKQDSQELFESLQPDDSLPSKRHFFTPGKKLSLSCTKKDVDYSCIVRMVIEKWIAEDEGEEEKASVSECLRDDRSADGELVSVHISYNSKGEGVASIETKSESSLAESSSTLVYRDLKCDHSVASFNVLLDPVEVKCVNALTTLKIVRNLYLGVTHYKFTDTAAETTYYFKNSPIDLTDEIKDGCSARMGL